MSNYLTIVAVGDRDSNKTELLLRYTGHCKSDRYPDYIMPRFENNVQDIIVDSIPRTVLFMDTECDEDYEILRRNAYEKADCILLCYSIGNKRTFRSLYRKWCQEVRRFAPFTPIILVGTELCKNTNKAISGDRGENLKLLIGAYAFIECSIETFLGIDDIFIEAVRSTYPRIKL